MCLWLEQVLNLFLSTTEIPSNIILKKISRPSWYLGALVMGFGLIVIFHGLVQNFSGLAGCRFMLGVFE